MKGSRLGLFLLVFSLLLVLGMGIVSAERTSDTIDCTLFSFNNYGSSGTDSLFSTIVNSDDDSALKTSFLDVLSNKQSTCFGNLLGVKTIPEHFSGTDYVGAFAGGYLYVTEKITLQNIWWQTGTSDNYEQFCADYNVGFFPIVDSSKNDLTKLDEGLGPWLQGSVEASMYLRSGEGNCVKDGFLGDDMTYKENTKPTYQTINPGLYYVIAVSHGHTNRNQKSYTSARLKPINLAESGYVTDLNQISNYGFAVTNKLLTAAQINNYFSASVETTKLICELAGGHINTTRMDDPSIGGCCGNSDADFTNTFYTDPETEKVYYCTADGWITKTNEDMCINLVQDSNYHEGDDAPFYVDGANEGYSFFQMDDVTLTPDGRDGCCGDDPWMTCDFDSSIDCSSLDVEDGTCANLGCTVEQTCSGGEIGCESFQNSNDECENAPEYCATRYDQYDGYPDGCLAVSGAILDRCEDMDSNNCPSEACTLVSSTCSGSPSGDYCSLKTTSNCGNEGFCSLVPAENSDVGYVSDDKRYFCSKDLYRSNNGDLSLSYFDIENVKNEWSWWDAKANNVPFKIHNINDIDFISNAKKWYYCAAGGEISNSNAIPIPEGESFPLSNNGGSFRCVDTLNSLVDFFDSHAGEDDYHLDYFSEKGYFTTCQNSSDKEYCCVKGADYAKDVYYDQGKFKEVCLDDCYLDETKRMSNVWVKNSPELSNFTVDFCQRFPWDNLCQESLDGDWTFGLESPETDLLLKSDCSFGMTGCFSQGVDVDGACESIQNYPFENYDYLLPDGSGTSNKYEGIKCDYGSMEDGFKYCTTGLYAKSGDTSQDDKSFCCLAPQGQYTPDTACVPVEGDMTPAICAAIEGDYYEDWENGADKAQCMTPIGSYEGCCVGGKWVFNWNKLAFEGLVQNESFICYQHGNEQRIAECCTEFSTCNNYNYNQKDTYSMFADSNRQDRTYFTSGGTIHNLENFDDWSENSDSGMLLLSDYVRVDRGIKKGNSMNVDFTTVIRNNNDWTTFNYLEFDIAYNLPKPLHVTLVSDGDGKTCTYSLNDYLVNGNSSMRWHHAVINISEKNNNPVCTADFDWTNVTALKIETDYTGGMSIALDSIYLSGGVDNTDNYYCTGNFGSWIKNLDGPNGNEGFKDTDEMVFEDYGPYWYACESQASFDWSGHRCCGDDTHIPYNKAKGQESGEYYYDTSMGCFGGNPVYENWRLGDTLNNPKFNGILYYNGEFHECIDDNSYKAYNVSFDGVTQNQNMPLITNTSTPYTIMGSYICSTNGDWVSLDEIPRSKIIASKLYDLTFEDGVQRDNYKLVCDSFDQASPYFNNSIIPKDELLYFTSDNADDVLVADFCTLSYYDDDGKLKIITGISLKQPVGVFLRKMTSYLANLVGTAIDEDEFADSCTNNNLGYSTNDDFFTICNQPDSSENLKMAYNPDFKILFMSYVVNKNDFNKLFKPSEGAIESFFEDFVHIFTKLFTKLFRSAKPNDEFVITTESALPRVLNDSATYNHIYLSRDGNKRIQAFKTTYKYQSNDIETINIEYYNFSTNVKPLALNYYNTRDYSINYMRGINKQIINIDKPKKLNSFEQDFDWRTLTTQLRVDATDVGTKITATNTPNDGIIDEDELCDYNSGEQIFRYSNLDCNFWNSSYDQDCGNVTCNQDGQINYNICSNMCYTPPSVCGNGVVEEGEDCDPPNTVQCTSTCQFTAGNGGDETCGNGNLDDGEQCDEGISNTDIPCVPSIGGSSCTYCDSSCVTQTNEPVCGDGVCNGDENHSSCFSDCLVKVIKP